MAGRGVIKPERKGADMTPKDLSRRVKKRPFVPFRLVVSEGATYDVFHPDQIIVMRDSVVVATPGDADDFYESSDLVDLIHVVRLEALPTKTKKGTSNAE
jgi:hypothetical protein